MAGNRYRRRDRHNSPGLGGAIMSECQTCIELTRIIEQQQLQIKRLNVEILRLKRIIDLASALCARLSMDADMVLRGSSPRGVWAYNKGQKSTAETISTVLYY
jgi:hypothetical protein